MKKNILKQMMGSLEKSNNKHPILLDPTPPQYVYRVDTRPPDVIFREGFRNLGNVRNFFEHIVSTNFGQSYFVSFSDTPTAAIRFFGSWLRAYVPQHPREAYLYEVRADDHFYNARGTGENLIDIIRTDRVTYESGDYDMARMGLNALRTSFSYQREWFSDGPVLGTSIRSAWRVDAVPIDPTHVHHPAGRVVETTRIHEPEILNEHYVELPTHANPNPWTPQAVAPFRLSVPQTANVADVSEGASASYAFACPDWSSVSNNLKTNIANSSNISPLDKCIFEETNEYSWDKIPLLAPSYGKEYQNLELYLTNNKGKNFVMYGYNMPKHSFTYVEETQKDEVTSLYENRTNNGVLPNFIFHYDTQERIVMNKTSGDDLSYCLTAIKTPVAGVFKLMSHVATNNHPEQKWFLVPMAKNTGLQNKRSTSYRYRISSLIFPNNKSGIYRRTNSTDQGLYLIAEGAVTSEFEELFLEIANDKTDFSFLTQRAALTHFSEIKLEWVDNNGSIYSPLLSGWSYNKRANPYKFFYDFKSEAIFFVEDNGDTYILTNNRSRSLYSWDWISWIKKPLSRVWIDTEKWFFSVRGRRQRKFINENYRIIRSHYNNDYLKVIYSGAKWGGWYTTDVPTEPNSIREFDLTFYFDR
ncbi:hypothetical protein [[Mycoplasma] collis]|uniref:hypothetical protein n=1 Tax=[Mycoplasma] collis TaxID=2127 RepID=UPI00068ECD95|nr:hypothetical protein [[Mycoplasma] collis]